MSALAGKRIVLLIAILAGFITPFDGSAVNIALPAMGAEFSMDAIMLSWIATAYLLAAALFGFYLVQADYRVRRIQGFFAAEKDVLGSGYQVEQSKLALGAGGSVDR